MSDIKVWEQRITALQQSVPQKITRAKWAMGGVVVLGVALLTPLAISGLIGTVVLMAIGTLALISVNYFPWLSKRLVNARTEALVAEANRHLQALKAEAAKNPIETLENEQQQKYTELEEEANAITAFDTEVEGLRQLLREDDVKKSSTASELTKDALSAMERKLSYRRLAYKRAQAAVAQADEVLGEMRVLWRVGLAAARADAASGAGKNDLQRKILEHTAVTAVRTQVNSAMAGLRTSIMKEHVSEEELRQLENNPSAVIDVQVTEVKQLQGAQR